MELRVFKDAACLEEIKAPQRFIRANASDSGTYMVYTLTAMTGAQLGALYRYNSVTYARLVQGTDYTLNTGTGVITLTTGLSTSDVLVALPTNKLDMLFSGTEGYERITSMPVYVARNPNYVYDMIYATSVDLDQTYLELLTPAEDVTFVADSTLVDSEGDTRTGSLGTGFGTLTAHILEGMLMVVDGTYIGTITANNTSSVLVDNTAYPLSGAINGEVAIFTAGELLFGLDNAGSAPADNQFKPVISIPMLDSSNEVEKIWVRNTKVIPAAPINFPDQAIKVVAVEYIE